MAFKNISKLYQGDCLTIREHLNKNTPISEFLIDYSEPTTSSTGKSGEYIGQEKYSGYIGDLYEEGGLQQLIVEMSTMLTKFLILKKMNTDERDIYSNKTIHDSIEFLISSANSLTKWQRKEIEIYIGKDRWKDLNDRLNTGLIKSFEIYEDSMLDRVLWLTQAINYRRTKDWKWFRYRSCIRNPEIKDEINKLSERALKKIWDIISQEKNPEVDLFPCIGYPGEIVVEPDLKINDKVFLITTDSRCLKQPKVKAILNAVSLLSKESGTKINERYIYCMRWNQLLKVS